MRKKQKKRENPVKKKIGMFNLMKISHAALLTDFSDEEKKKGNGFP
jgi:hypothetical protein